MPTYLYIPLLHLTAFVQISHNKPTLLLFHKSLQSFLKFIAALNIMKLILLILPESYGVILRASEASKIHNYNVQFLKE